MTRTAPMLYLIATIVGSLSASADEPVHPAHTILTAELLADDRVLLDGRPIRLSEFEQQVAALRLSKNVLTVTADMSVSHTQVVELMNLGARAGYPVIRADTRRYTRSEPSLDVLDDNRVFLNGIEVQAGDLVSHIERLHSETAGSMLAITASSGATWVDVNQIILAAVQGGFPQHRIVSESAAADTATITGMIVTTVNEREPMERLVEFYQRLRPDLAAQILQDGSALEDSSIAEVIRRLPADDSVAILLRMDEVRSLAVRDWVRRLASD